MQAGLAVDDVQAAIMQAEELQLCRLKDKGRIFRETFLAKLGLLLRGTVAAPPERFGETIEDERIRGGADPPRDAGCDTGSGSRGWGLGWSSCCHKPQLPIGYVTMLVRRLQAHEGQLVQ